MLMFKVEVSELCTLNPELLDHVNAVTSKAADPPAPAPDKVLFFSTLQGKLVVSVDRLNYIYVVTILLFHNYNQIFLLELLPCFVSPPISNEPFLNK